MKTNLILLIILASISNITYGQCNDLDKAIANYEMHLVGKRTDKFERIKYQKAYLVATNICSCDHANSSDIFLAERILNKLYSVSATFSFEKERLDEALEFCEASYLVIHSSDSNDSSSIFNQDYSISFLYSDPYHEETLDIDLLVAEEEERVLDSLRNRGAENISKIVVYLGLNSKTQERLSKVMESIGPE